MNIYVNYIVLNSNSKKKEPMDTTESMKSDTPQPATKEQSPQKEQTDNNIAGMSRLFSVCSTFLFVF